VLAGQEDPKFADDGLSRSRARRDEQGVAIRERADRIFGVQGACIRTLLDNMSPEELVAEFTASQPYTLDDFPHRAVFRIPYLPA